MTKRTYLIDEYPLLVLPSLAKMIGLNEAIALQQLHYWLQNPKGGIVIDGYRWVYNTYEQWQSDNFPFWSVRTVIRVFGSLEKMELVISRQDASYDRKKYYRIHYDNLATWKETDCHNADLQNGKMDSDKVASSLTDTTQRLPETSSAALAQISKAYESEIGMLTPFIADSLQEAADLYPVKWTLDAIHEAAVQNKRNWKYIEAILKRWKAQGNQEQVRPQNGQTSAPTPAINTTAVQQTQKMLAEKWSITAAPPPTERPRIGKQS